MKPGGNGVLPVDVCGDVDVDATRTAWILGFRKNVNTPWTGPHSSHVVGATRSGEHRLDARTRA
jgi:hypothetical protein